MLLEEVSMLKSLLIVGMGSFVGGAARYYLSALIKGCCNQGFPWGTLAVNLVGCFLFGMLFALLHRMGLHNSSWALLLTTGLGGGFSTFSTFANESMLMLQGGHFGAFASYVAASVILGIGLVALGYTIFR